MILTYNLIDPWVGRLASVMWIWPHLISLRPSEESLTEVLWHKHISTSHFAPQSVKFSAHWRADFRLHHPPLS